MPNTVPAGGEAVPTNSPKSAQAIDQIDKGIEILETIWLALQAKGWIDDGALVCLSGSLSTAIGELRPVREALNGVDMRITL